MPLWNIFRKLSLPRILLILFGGGLGLVILAIGSYEIIGRTESAVFCGQVCHEPMAPEYTVYKASPHSTVSCSSCHVGPGTYALVSSKMRGIPQLAEVITGNYPRPILSPVKDLRPARETCEKCHWPEKFSGDLVRTRTVFGSDVANTKRTNTIVLKAGGGASNAGGGIHWHITSKVWYLPLDEERLQIGWVGVEQGDGTIKEYVDPVRASDITPAWLKKEKRLMDCVDCHNRATHIFGTPADLIDTAMAEGRIDGTLPFIKREGVSALDPQNPSLVEADAKVEAIADFYRSSYPRVYQDKAREIDAAIGELKKVARLTTFPEMNVNWTTHVDNSGHNRPPDETMQGWNVKFDDWRENRSPGCFRCHGTLVPVSDEKATTVTLVSETQQPSGNGVKKRIDISCNLCHYSMTAQAGSPLPKSIPHTLDKLEDCMLCHGKSATKPIAPDHPWSTNDACQACHKVESVAVAAAATGKAPPDTAKSTPHTTRKLEDCLICHNKSAPKPFSDNHPWSTNDTCSACHATAASLLPSPKAKPPSDSAKAVPHTSRRLENCLVCHDKSAPKPIGTNHPWSSIDTCSACHGTAATMLPLPKAKTGSTLTVSHSTRGLEDCLLCHGRSAVRQFSSNHPWSTNETCSACHAAAQSVAPIPLTPTRQPPRIPHSTQGLSDCRVCHAGPGPRPFPADHSQIPSSYCTLCHRG